MKRFFLLALLALAAPLARANDGSITWGEAPSLTKNHPWVEMRSEVVRLKVGTRQTRVECDFVFVNHGPACTVRMGFPDHTDDDHEEQSTVTYFKGFRSFVDGREVKVQSANGPLEDGYRVKWSTKPVRFGARGTLLATRRVRDTYLVETGGETRTSVTVASYTLHTGSSWRGPIGRSEIIVSFPGWRGPFRAVSLQKAYSMTKDNDLGVVMKPAGTLLYKGPGKGRVEGQTLRWVRTKWRPGIDDDIQITFRY